MRDETNGTHRRLVLNEDAVRDLEVSEGEAVRESAEAPNPDAPNPDAPNPVWHGG